MAIEARHYHHAREALARDPVVIAMTHGMTGIPESTFREADGAPTWDFTLAAMREYQARASALRAAGHPPEALYPLDAPMHIGAVAEAICLLLDAPQPPGGEPDAEAPRS